MNASELIKTLTDLVKEHGDYEIVTEGCDCYGDVGRVSVEPGADEEPPYFLLNRSHQ